MNPGSAIISSDAAKALDIVQNEQTKVQIIAVRAAKGASPTQEITEPNEVNVSSLGSVIS